MPSVAGIRYIPLNTEESSNTGAEVVPLASTECGDECQCANSGADFEDQAEVTAALTTTDVDPGGSEEVPPPTLTVILPPPPCYDELEAGVDNITTQQHEAAGDNMPPPNYNVAAKLPTYEEAERSKGQEANEDTSGRTSRLADAFPYRYTTILPGFDDYQELDLTGNSNIRLGNDVVFFSTFLIAFLFNWIGFLISHCFSQSIAGRFGALAGFGLSMVKWTVIMKHSFQVDAMQSEWLWWIILLLGLAMFFRGTVQYIRIKHQWSNLTSEARIRYARFF